MENQTEELEETSQQAVEETTSAIYFSQQSKGMRPLWKK